MAEHEWDIVNFLQRRSLLQTVPQVILNITQLPIIEMIKSTKIKKYFCRMMGFSSFKVFKWGDTVVHVTAEPHNCLLYAFHGTRNCMTEPTQQPDRAHSPLGLAAK